MLAEEFGVPVGEPRQLLLADELAGRAAEWDEIRAERALDAPALAEFLTTSPALTDFSLGNGPQGLRRPTILSTVKLRRAGFWTVLGAEEMFRKWIRRYQASKLLPTP